MNAKAVPPVLLIIFSVFIGGYFLGKVNRRTEPPPKPDFPQWDNATDHAHHDEAILENPDWHSTATPQPLVVRPHFEGLFDYPAGSGMRFVIACPVGYQIVVKQKDTKDDTWNGGDIHCVRTPK